MMSQGRLKIVDDRALRFRVKGWSIISFSLLTMSLIMTFQGGFYIDVDGQRLGLGTMLWLPGLIASCSCLWLLMTMSGARTNISLPISLAALAGAEVCALLIPIREISGLNWDGGNGLVPAISFASLALTALTWTATMTMDPLRQNWWTYGVALVATVLIGFILSYQYFWFLQGVMATSLAGALTWGLAYDHHLQVWRKEKKGLRPQAPGMVFLASFLALPLLMIGLPYLMQ